MTLCRLVTHTLLTGTFHCSLVYVNWVGKIGRGAARMTWEALTYWEYYLRLDKAIRKTLSLWRNYLDSGKSSLDLFRLTDTIPLGKVYPPFGFVRAGLVLTGALMISWERSI